MREPKKIVLYFGKEREDNENPFKDFGLKKQVYLDLFQKGIGRGFLMFISSGPKAYLGNLEFNNLLRFEDGEFKVQEGAIKADAVFDRSGVLAFPPEEISSKVLNNLGFKKLCADKMATYDFIGEFMPESFLISNEEQLKKYLANFRENELVVLKPVDEFGGSGIEIGFPSIIEQKKLLQAKMYALQRFVETSCGIEDIIEGRHDFRVIIVNGKMVLAHVRAPKDGGFLANVSQGGSIKEVSLEKMPQSILNIVKVVQQKVDEKFDRPIYSIDFGVCDGKPYVFELNDRIGFPGEDMQNASEFVDSILDSLLLRSKR